jgi:hypothetical protein
MKWLLDGYEAPTAPLPPVRGIGGGRYSGIENRGGIFSPQPAAAFTSHLWQALYRSIVQ